MSESNTKKDEYLKSGPLLDLDTDGIAKVDTKSGEFKSLNSDINPVIKKTLKDYLGAKTRENGSYYQIDSKDRETSIYSGDPLYTPQLTNNTNSEQYKPDFLNKTLEENLIKKGKLQNEISQNGNLLLKDNNPTFESSPAKSYISAALIKNRFTSENSYTKDFKDATFSIRKYKKSSTENGLIKLDNDSSNVNVKKDGIQLSVDNMNELAETLLLRASGKNIVDPQINNAQGGPNNIIGGPGAAVLIPGLTQILPGLKMDGLNYDVNEIAKLFEGDKLAVGDTSNYQNHESYGVLNNYFDKFSKSSIGTTLLSAAIILSTMAAITIVMLPMILLSYLYDEKKPENPTKINRPSDINDILFKALGFKSPKNRGKERYVRGWDYYTHVFDGLTSFFNPFNLLFSYGYYVILCRSIIRDVLDVIDRYPKGTDKIEYWDNIISLDSLDMISTSKLVSAVNLFVSIADLNQTKPYDLNNKNSIILDSIPGGQSKFEYPKPGNEGEIPYDDDVERLDANIISDKSETIPFYIQDLKSKKFISFRATLSEFSETYSPQWEENFYFGRIDPIKTYKSTTRKISVSFKIFSTSETDHQEMWKKIDSLTSLVYPELSEKRKSNIILNDKTINVSIPYSQNIEKQPLIRIKIGDYIKNNISNDLSSNLNIQQILQYTATSPAASTSPTTSSATASPTAASPTAASPIAVTTAEHKKVKHQKVTFRNFKMENFFKSNKPANLSIIKSLFKDKVINLTGNCSAYIPLHAGVETKLQCLNETGKDMQAKLLFNNSLKIQKFGGFETMIKKSNKNVLNQLIPIVIPTNDFFYSKSIELISISIGIPASYTVLSENAESISNPPYISRIWGYFSIDKGVLTDLLNINIKDGKLSDILQKTITTNSPGYYECLSTIGEFFLTQSEKALFLIDLTGYLGLNPEKAVKNKDIQPYLTMKTWFEQPLKAPAALTTNVSTPSSPARPASPPPAAAPVSIQDFESIEKNPIYRAIMNNYGLGAPAYIDNLSYKVVDGYMWELESFLGAGRKPKIIDVSMDLTIIHDFIPYSDITDKNIAMQYYKK